MSPFVAIHMLVFFVSPVITSVYWIGPDVHEDGSRTWCLLQPYWPYGTGFRTKIIIITTRCRFRSGSGSGVFLPLVRYQLPLLLPYHAPACSHKHRQLYDRPERISTVGVTVDMNQFNTIECLCSVPPALVIATRVWPDASPLITVYPLRLCHLPEQCSWAACRITGVVATNSQHITRSISSQVRVPLLATFPATPP